MADETRQEDVTPEAPREDDVRPLNDDGVSGHAQPGYPEGATHDTSASVEPADRPVSQMADPVGNATNPISRRDVDGIAGQFVDVVDGEHRGRFGHYVNTVSRDEDGVPETILIRTRDARNELLEVAYSEVRPSERAGGR